MNNFLTILKSFELECEISQIILYYKNDLTYSREYTICDEETVDTEHNVSIIVQDLQNYWPIKKISFQEYIKKYFPTSIGRLYILVDRSTLKQEYTDNKKLYFQKLGAFSKSTRSTETHVIFYYLFH